MMFTAYTESDAKLQERRDRDTAMTLADIQMVSLQDKYKKRGEVSHSIFKRLVQSVIKIGKHIGLTAEDRQSFEKKLNDASVGDDCTVNLSGEGNKIYISGFFDLDKLRKEMLW